jgi:hypothetical protein
MTNFDPAIGDLSHEGEMRGNQVKGNLVNSRAWYVREHYGAESIPMLAEQLSPESREYLVVPSLSFAWKSMGPLIDLDRAIFTSLMKSDITKMREFGAEIAMHDLPTIYKTFMRLGTPSFVLSKVSVACGMYFKETTLRAAKVSPRESSIALVGRRWPLYLCSWGLEGWFNAAVTLSGAKNATTIHSSCLHRGDAECRWDVTWG